MIEFFMVSGFPLAGVYQSWRRDGDWEYDVDRHGRLKPDPGSGDMCRNLMVPFLASDIESLTVRNGGPIGPPAWRQMAAWVALLRPPYDRLPGKSPPHYRPKKIGDPNGRQSFLFPSPGGSRAPRVRLPYVPGIDHPVLATDPYLQRKGQSIARIVGGRHLVDIFH